MSIFQIVFSFKGRIGVGTFWAASLSAGVLLGLVFAIFAGAHDGFFEQAAKFWQHPEETPIAIWFCLPVFIWVTAAINVKRLHDLDMSGWWTLFFCVPILISAIAVDLARAGVDSGNVAYSLISLPLSLGSLLASLYSFWISIQMMFFPGDKQPNNFGPETGSAYASDKSPDEGEVDQILARRGMAQTAVEPAPVVQPKTAQPARPSGFGRRGHPA
jgi:uncharacterized membrane protein YhaH (DUF805 family)